MVPRNTSPSTPRNAATPHRAADHRDQIIGATLVGTVLVLLGYASGIGGGGCAAQAAGRPAPGVIARSPGPSDTGPPPALREATGHPGAPSGAGYGYGYAH